MRWAWIAAAIACMYAAAAEWSGPAWDFLFGGLFVTFLNAAEAASVSREG